MATVSSVVNLIDALTTHVSENAGLHAWLDAENGLVFGSFPTPTSRYDFAFERIVSLGTSDERQLAKEVVSLTGRAKRFRAPYEIETATKIYKVASATQALVEGLKIIEAERPGTLEKLSAFKKRSKRAVARSFSDLYDTPHPKSHAAQLPNGFWVGTNNQSYEAIGVLRHAADIANIEFNVRPSN